MRIRKINFQEINFEYCSYPQSMYDSIKRIGLSFPIKVNIINGKYYCKDGHKRLSIIQDLLKNEEGYESAVPAGGGRSGARVLCWLCRAERSCPDQGKGRAGHADECGVSAV